MKMSKKIIRVLLATFVIVISLFYLYSKGTYTAYETKTEGKITPSIAKWNIKVDGKEVQPVKIFDSLIGIELSAGTHEIEFKYIPRGLYVGAGVSIVSLLLFIILRKKK